MVVTFGIVTVLILLGVDALHSRWRAARKRRAAAQPPKPTWDLASPSREGWRPWAMGKPAGLTTASRPKAPTSGGCLVRDDMRPLDRISTLTGRETPTGSSAGGEADGAPRRF
jgi:hypothetical protein